MVKKIITLGLLILFSIQANATQVKKIEINGLDRIETSTVLNYLDIKINQDINDYDLSEGLKKLYKTKFFSNVTIDFNLGIIKIDVKENPIIASVLFNGIKSSIAKSLKEAMHTQERGIYSKDNIKFDAESIKMFFIKSGSLTATITPRVKVLDKRRVEIIFDVDEGNIAQVDKVIFIGNSFFNDFSLVKKISLRGRLWWDLFSYGNTYSEEKINADQNTIIEAYMDEGFADFKVTSTTAEYNKEVSQFSLSYFIDEGEKYSFGDSKIESKITNFPGSEVPVNLIENKQGKLYQQSKINNTIKNINKFLSNKGLLNAKIIPIITKKDQVASIIYEIQPINVSYIDKIEISGNYKTHDAVIRRELLIAEGDLYRDELIKQSKDKLYMLDYFDNVEIKEKYTSKGTVELEIAITERTRSDGINLSAGYASIGGLIFGVGLTKNNLFGRGYNASVGFTKAIFMTQYSATFTNPRFLDKDISLSFTVSNTQFGSPSINLPFSSVTTALGVSVGYQVVERLYQYWGFTFQENRLAIDTGSTSRLGNGTSLPNGIALYNAMSNYALADILSHTLVLDHRNSHLLPTKGFLAKFTNSLSGYTGIGGQKYIQNDLSMAFYTPTINEDFILTVAFQGGTIQGIGDSVLWQNRYAVGYYNFRGFSFLGVGPAVEINSNGSNFYQSGIKANNYAVGSIELSFPLPIPKEHMVRAYAFCDFGTAFGFDGQSQYNGGASNTERIIDNSALRLAVGVGFTWIGPIGPIRIDYAQPILFQPYDILQQFRITFTPNIF